MIVYIFCALFSVLPVTNVVCTLVFAADLCTCISTDVKLTVFEMVKWEILIMFWMSL